MLTYSAQFAKDFIQSAVYQMPAQMLLCNVNLGGKKGNKKQQPSGEVAEKGSWLITSLNATLGCPGYISSLFD